jgi:mannose-6-phosphate isomerase-like protein (cupin superfamily)
MPATTVRAGESDRLNVLGMPLRFLCDSRETGGAWSLFEEDVPLGMGPPPHRHAWDEAYYVLKGEVNFEIDGQSVTVRAGDFARLPANTVHGFKGASADGARVLIFAAPGHASAFFEEVNNEVRSLPDDLSKIPEIGLRHGIEFVPA